MNADSTTAEREIRELHARWFAASRAEDLSASMAPIAAGIVSYEHSAPLQYTACERGGLRGSGEVLPRSPRRPPGEPPSSGPSLASRPECLDGGARPSVVSALRLAAHFARVTLAAPGARRRRRKGDPVETAQSSGESRPSFIGVTRYSVFQPTSPKWKLTRKKLDPDSYRGLLWSASRMQPRQEIFLGMAVPLLQAMADRFGYRHIVQYSADMPDPWLSVLLDAAATYPVLHLHENTAGNPVAPTAEQLLAAERRPSRPVVQFRVDDDDILAADYLDQIAPYATPADAGRAVSLASGYAALYSEGRIAGPVRTVRRLFSSHGLAYVGHFDAERQTVDIDGEGAHDLVDRRMPTIVDSRTPAFFQMRHTGQDTHVNTSEAIEKIEAELAKRPEVDDAASVARLFPTLEPLLAQAYTR